MKSRFKIHKPINVDTLVKRIGEHFGFTLSDLKGKRRTDAHISCRFAVYHVLRKMLKMPYAQIGKILNRDHGAVMNGVQQFNDWATVDTAAKRALIACEAIGNSWIIECDYHVATEPAVNQQSVNNGKGAVNTKGGKTLKVNTKTDATIHPLFTGEEKSTYIYKYNSKNSISFKLVKQLNNKDVFNTITEYINYRRQTNKRLTQAGLDMLLKKLIKYNAAIVVETLEASIANGWQGVFPEKINANNKSNNTKYNDKAKADYNQAVEHGSTETVGEVF